MITIRKARDRGHADYGWLKTAYTFSFAEYHDPDHMGYRSLRVMNEDRVDPGQGFGTHPHRDMEILTFVLDGAVAHKDSMGNGSEIRPGEVQRMTAGTGVTHSEFNPDQGKSLHLYQVWILPEARGLEPGYEQKRFTGDEKRGRLRLVASRDGRDGSVTIHQDAEVWSTILAKGEAVVHPLRAGRGAWVQVVHGTASVNGERLQTSDGAAIESEDGVRITTDDTAEILLFDLA